MTLTTHIIEIIAPFHVTTLTKATWIIKYISWLVSCEERFPYPESCVVEFLLIYSYPTHPLTGVIVLTHDSYPPNKAVLDNEETSIVSMAV